MSAEEETEGSAEILLTMPRRKRPNIGRRSRSNVRRATSRANRTDDQQETDNDNSRIGMAHLRSTVNQKWIDKECNEFGHIDHNSSEPGKRKLTDSANAMLL
ncbi:hypothetical protein J6590_100388 [Homalodisca vitripennis]|nr:hypothetical protein J6590_100388 [Homalodisca vitripennis]